MVEAREERSHCAVAEREKATYLEAHALLEEIVRLDAACKWPARLTKWKVQMRMPREKTEVLGSSPRVGREVPP